MNALWPEMPFGELTLSGDRPFLIAEAGVNHEGNLEVALRMVEEAAASGADAIKFQSYKAETLASRNSPAYWDLRAEPTKSQFDLFRKYDAFGDEEYARLAERARSVGIVFLSTPFDDHFVDALEPLVPAYKVASADLVNTPFLERIARKRKPIILSTGASTLSEIDVAIETVRKAGGPPLALLHCMLCYPCSPDQANLGVIVGLRRRYPDIIVGYSDHVPPSPGLPVLVTAWSLGARILEKHFTLDKTLPGNDHYHAMDTDDIRAFRRACESMEILIGEDERRVFPCEEAARLQARRSLVAACQIREGTIVTRGMIEVKRPGTGISPGDLERVIGLRVGRDIEQDEIMLWEFFPK